MAYNTLTSTFGNDMTFFRFDIGDVICRTDGTDKNIYQITGIDDRCYYMDIIEGPSKGRNTFNSIVITHMQFQKIQWPKEEDSLRSGSFPPTIEVGDILVSKRSKNRYKIDCIDPPNKCYRVTWLYGTPTEDVFKSQSDLTIPWSDMEGYTHEKFKEEDEVTITETEIILEPGQRWDYQDLYFEIVDGPDDGGYWVAKSFEEGVEGFVYDTILPRELASYTLYVKPDYEDDFFVVVYKGYENEPQVYFPGGREPGTSNVLGIYYIKPDGTWTYVKADEDATVTAS